MKDAFKVQASGEVFSDTQIAELQAKLHVGLIKNLTQCTQHFAMYNH